MPSIQDIQQRIREYLPDEDLSPLEKAYEYAAEIHAGERHHSGMEYIDHLLAVTYTLAAMRLDSDTLVAGLLHGALKKDPSPDAEQELRRRFGNEVAAMVSGATRIANVQYRSNLDYQAENIKKMLVAMAADIRVLLLKLADKLHDMQTLGRFPKEKQEETARETMDLYAPLASRLGIDWMKRELEDLAFAYLHPAEFTGLSSRIKTSSKDRQAYVDAVKKILYTKLGEHGLTDCHILGRPKHLWSIYRKIIAQNIPLEKVYDKVAFRIIVKTVGECYEALGVVHSLWTPIAGRFKDFISSPKANLYQSLHTSVVGPYGEFMEVQIRTEEMDEIAKEGIAAHWAYKEGMAISRKDAKLFQWLKHLVQWLQELKDPKEFLDAVKGELHRDEIYVLTPRGEVKEFPGGSTSLDFAYSIHTEVGTHCVGAKINGRLAPLKQELKNGDLIEIITSPNQWPNRGWLSLVKTSRAKNRIRSWLNREEQEKSLKVGREICERELRKHALSLKKITKTGHIREVLQALSCHSPDDLLRKVGSGKIPVQAIIKTLAPEEAEKEEPLVLEPAPRKGVRKSAARDAISIDGIDNMLTKISHCCMPVPGDEIMGFITAGHGISVHKARCPNLLATDPQRRIEVEWTTGVQSSHQALIQIIAQDKKGLLATLSNAISTDDANIINVEAHASGNNLARLNLVVEVAGVDHLTRLLQHIRQLDEVIEAKRR